MIGRLFGMITGNWVVVAVALAALAGATGLAYHKGFTNATARAAQDQLAAVRNALEQREAVEAENHEIAVATQQTLRAELEAARARRTEVIKYVEVHPTRVECFGSDGLRLIAAAARGERTAEAGRKPARALPGDAP